MVPSGRRPIPARGSRGACRGRRPHAREPSTMTADPPPHDAVRLATLPAPRPPGAPARSPADPPPDDAVRLATLRATRLMDSPPEASFDRMPRLAARLLHTPVALVSLVDDRRQFFKSAVGLGEPWASARE